MPRNPVQIVEEQLNALRALLRIARQPAALEVMKLIVQEHYSANGNGQHGPKRGATPERRGAVWDTGIQEEIEKVLPLLKDMDFTYKQVVEALSRNGYEVAAANPRTAVGRVLRKLVDRKIIREVKKGIAGAPSLYTVP